MDQNKIVKYNNRKTGNIYERRAAEYLKSNGLNIIEMNYNLRGGEIDIICLDGDTYVFVEVKYRKNSSHGLPVEAVTYEKQRRICRTATIYIKSKKLPLNGSFRFDVISILNNEITWYKNAFLYHT